MISIERNEQIHFYLICLFSFLIPSFPLAVNIVGLLILFNWLLIPRNIGKGFKIVIANYGLVAMMVLYSIYLIGMLYTDDLKEGFMSLQIKLPFLLFPFILGTYSEVHKKNSNHYLKWFTLGCVTYALMCLICAGYRFLKPVYTDLYGVLYDLGADYFYYTYLSVFFHPSYSAMYSLFGLVSIAYLWERNVLRIKWIWLLSAILLLVFILLLSSKAGWIGLFLLAVIFLFRFVKKNFIVTISLLFSVVLLFLFLNVYRTSSFSQRIPKTEDITKAIKGTDENNNKVTTSTEGTGSRIFVWKASLEIVKENFWWGVGTGDAKKEMLDKYSRKGMITEYKFQLNSHNQYLNTFIAVGLLGIISLLLCIIIPLFYSFREKKFLLVVFIGIVGINLLFESMFERQAGVIFYVFFNTLLSLPFKRKQE